METYHIVMVVITLALITSSTFMLIDYYYKKLQSLPEILTDPEPPR